MYFRCQEGLITKTVFRFCNSLRHSPLFFSRIWTLLFLTGIPCVRSAVRPLSPLLGISEKESSMMFTVVASVYVGSVSCFLQNIITDIMLNVGHARSTACAGRQCYDTVTLVIKWLVAEGTRPHQKASSTEVRMRVVGDQLTEHKKDDTCRTRPALV